MRFILAAAALAAALPLAAPLQAQAPTWSPEQQSVWAVVEQSWKDEVERNGRWPGSYAEANMIAWDAGWPMPRGRDSVERWSRWRDKAYKTVQYEIQPMAISVSGNTAVVNYGAVQMSQREVARGESAPKPEREMFGVSETLVRTAAGWKFLSSTSFEMGDDD
jgi:hypothetical protein